MRLLVTAIDGQFAPVSEGRSDTRAASSRDRSYGHAQASGNIADNLEDIVRQDKAYVSIPTLMDDFFFQLQRVII